MPLQDIMNAPTSFGPSISEQQQNRDLSMAQGYAGVADTMAGTEMNRMKMDTMRERSNILKNFEGRTDSPEFYSKMGSVDPDLVMKMKEKTASMDEKQRAMMKQRFEKIATMAEMDYTDIKWQERGWNQPFADRERIISHGMTLQQAFDYNKEEYDRSQGTGSGKPKGGMKAADENAIHSYTQDLFEGIYNPVSGGFMGFKKDTSRQQAAKIGAEASRIVANNSEITLHEAVMKAAKSNGVEIVPVDDAENPLGLER